MKKFIVFLLLQCFVIQTYASTGFPAFPMTIWGSLKNNNVNIPAGAAVQFLDSSGVVLSSYVTTQNGQFGGDLPTDKNIALGQFSGNLKIKVIYSGNTYTILPANIDDSQVGSGCPNKSAITFFSGVCKYNINLAGDINLVGGTESHTGSTILSTGAINPGSSLNLQGTNIIINGDTFNGSLILSGITNITASGTSWDGILIPPTQVSAGANENATAGELSVFIPVNSTPTIFSTIKVGGNGTSLYAVGSNFKVSMFVSDGTIGSILKVFRSSNGNIWEANTPDSTCTLDTNKMCTFYTNHLSYFSPVLITANVTSGGNSSGGGGGGGGGFIPATTSTGSTTNSGANLPEITNTNSTQSGTTQTVTKPSTQIPVVNKFTDIDNTFAKDDILKLYSKGVIKGYSDGTFKPENPVTRAEFLSIVMKAFGITVNDKTTTQFTDIPTEGSWMIKYIEAAKSYKIISGQTINGKLVFRPNDSISRGEAVAILFRSVNYPFKNYTSTQFTDIPVESSWMIKYIETAKDFKIISGQTIDNKLIFRPNDSTTRAESVKMISKLMEYIKK